MAAACAMAGSAAEAVVTFNTVATGFIQSTAVTGNTGRAGDTRVFVANKDGLIEAYDRGTGAKAAFLDLRGTLATGGEQGLIGVTFDPDYGVNGRYYVHVNAQRGGSGPVYSEIRRYIDPAIAGTAAPLTLISVQQPVDENHKGGWIGFDKTGMLMMALGDGGGAFDPYRTGQNASDLLGSILRIDPNSDAYPADPNRNYAIPAGNAATPGAAPEVFAYGVRNPFGDSIAPNGDLIVADVGQGQREELTIVTLADVANRNLGWSLREGDIATPFVGGPEPADHLAPDLAYDHVSGDRSIIGGFVYRGSAVSELFGKYVFGDAVSGRIWSIGYDGSGFVGTREELGVFESLTAFGETVDGELLLTQFSYLDGHLIQLGSSSAVPEPAAWAMLLSGFMLVGGALRGRTGARLAI